MLISRVPVLVSVWRVVVSVGLTVPVGGPWVWLVSMLGVVLAVDVCRTTVGAGVKGVACAMVASVGDSGAELLVMLLNSEDEVAGREGVVVLVVGVDAVSSVICDLKKQVNGLKH